MPNIYFTKDIARQLENPDSEDEELISASNVEILKYIDKSIPELDDDALAQIFKLIKKNDEKYTIKKDAILINIGLLKPQTVLEILKFLRYIRKNIKILLRDEKIKDQYKKDFIPDTESNIT